MWTCEQCETRVNDDTLKNCPICNAVRSSFPAYYKTQPESVDFNWNVTAENQQLKSPPAAVTGDKRLSEPIFRDSSRGIDSDGRVSHETAEYERESKAEIKRKKIRGILIAVNLILLILIIILLNIYYGVF